MSETKINFFNKLKSTAINKFSSVPDITGQTVEDFYVEKRMEIPSGEADIYLCSGTENHAGKKFILKYYRRENAVKPEVIAKLRSISSPYVAPVSGFGEFQGHQYTIRPYYEFPALSDVLSAGTRFSENELKTYIIPSAIEGLKVVHDAGILHRDLKPGNLIPDDKGEHIVLIDFGISSNSDGVTFVMTQPGMTPFYAAPEAIQGIYHRETDYYALGITIFELFTGYTPFQNPDISGEEAAKLAAISKIEFPDNFPENLRKLVLGLTYKDISHRNEKDNPNRRWGYDEVKRWLNGENVPVPGELNSGNDTFNFFGNTNESLYIFSRPYDFRSNQGQIVKLNTLSEFTEAFGLNWEDGKKHVGRSLASKFFIQQDMQNIASIIMDCEDAGATDFAYAKMLIELSGSTNNLSLYWNSVRIDNNMKILSDILTKELFNQSNNLKEEYDNVKQLLILWYETNEKNRELSVIEKLQQIADVNKQDIATQIIALCSFIDPNIAVKIGDSIYKDKDELINFTNRIKNNKQLYYEWLLKNQSDIKRYTECINSSIKQIAKNLLNDLQPELDRLNRLQREQEEREIRTFGIPLSSIKKGAFIKYGNYPLTADGQKAPIEWIALDFNEKVKEVLLISRYGLECKQYHNELDYYITWEDCDLRKWLNNDFIKYAFSEEEAKRIKVSELKNEDNHKYRTKGGNDTKDRIFCLSIDEAEQYFSSDKDRQCQPTAYARNQGVLAIRDYCSWWLRSPGAQFCATEVNIGGALNLCGYAVCDGLLAVRPALRIICNL